MEADGALSRIRRDSRRREARLAPRSARRGHEGDRAAGPDLDASHVVVGRVLRRHGVRELVHRLPLRDRYLG